MTMLIVATLPNVLVSWQLLGENWLISTAKSLQLQSLRINMRKYMIYIRKYDIIISATRLGVVFFRTRRKQITLLRVEIYL